MTGTMTLHALLEKAARTDPAKIAIVYGDQRIRYDELLERVDRCAARLREDCGVGAGDCVAALLPNCPEFPVAFFAAASIGAIFLPLNPQYKEEELRGLLEDARPRVIVSNGPGMAGWNGVPVIAARQLMNGSSPTPASCASPSSRALYLYTSGSTDSCKRVCCTQENLYWEARNFVETAGLSAADTILCTVPLFHSYGIGNCLLDAAYLGATLVLLPPASDPNGAEPPFATRCHQVADLFRAEQIRFYPGVPHQFSVLSSLSKEFPIDLSSGRLFVSSADALPATTYARFLQRFGKAIRSLYGSTEAGSISIDMDSDALLEYGSVGRPLNNVIVEIRGAGGSAGADGEIWVKSPTSPPAGYDNRPDLSGTVFRDGFYNTGDIGHLDPRGRLLLAGRRQSFINIAGNKVDTSEVEAVLEACPGVREAAVLGVEIPRMGTLVKAAVVTDETCGETEIRAFCRQRLAFYKVPRLIETCDALPRSAVGKVLKSELSGAEQYLAKIRSAESVLIAAQIPSASPARRRSLIASLVHLQAAAVLARPVSAVPRDAGFTELGMDSFSSIELLARLEYLFDRELPQTFTFDHPTIDAVTEALMEPAGSAGALAAPLERS